MRYRIDKIVIEYKEVTGIVAFGKEEAKRRSTLKEEEERSLLTTPGGSMGFKLEAPG